MASNNTSETIGALASYIGNGITTNLKSQIAPLPTNNMQELEKITMII